MRAIASVIVTLVFSAGGTARAAVSDVVITGGGGYGGVSEYQLCPDGHSGCGAGFPAGTVLLGVGLLSAPLRGLRGGMRVEGGVELGRRRGNYLDLIGVAGWQGVWMMGEIGLGGSVVWGGGPAPRRRELGRLLHAGFGFRLNPALGLVARFDLLPTESMSAVFLGLALEWQPWAAPGRRSLPWSP
jgi:hypothetical protein